MFGYGPDDWIDPIRLDARQAAHAELANAWERTIATKRRVSCSTKPIPPGGERSAARTTTQLDTISLTHYGYWWGQGSTEKVRGVWTDPGNVYRNCPLAVSTLAAITLTIVAEFGAYRLS